MAAHWLLGVPAKLKTLLDRLTADRAGRLDEVTATRMGRLDATISSRAAQSSANTLLSRLTSTRAARLDVDISSRASQSSVNAIPTSAIASVQDGTATINPFGSTSNTDVPISGVNAGKSLVNLPTAFGAHGGNFGDGNGFVIAYLVNNGTDIRIRAGGLEYNDDIEVRWQVVEYN